MLGKIAQWLILLAVAGAIYFLVGGGLQKGADENSGGDPLSSGQSLLQAAQAGQPAFLVFYGDY